MKFNECNNCVEHNCKECLIFKIGTLSEKDFNPQPEVPYVTDHDFSVEMILR